MVLLHRRLTQLGCYGQALSFHTFRGWQQFGQYSLRKILELPSVGQYRAVDIWEKYNKHQHQMDPEVIVLE